MKVYSLFLLMLLCGLNSCKPDTKLFTLLGADETGVTFANRIIPNDSMNIIDFEYVYNGGGVGIGDFDKDGLQDVYFTGNMVPNKLYLNRGDFKFEDITEDAGVGGEARWCAGVTVVDINQDGWMDIYVSATVRSNGEDRRNLLYVNQGLENGKPVFREMAEEYGVADEGHGEHAAFFDYDHDGDLDLYVLIDVITQYPNLYRDKINDGSAVNTDRLYRNDWSDSLGHPVFTDVSRKAGINAEGYGLGLNICDINRDGWQDIYVTNDYAADDLLYINNQDGTFTDQAQKYLKHISNSAMGNDVTDMNGDGYADIVALDMLPYDNNRKKSFGPPNNYQVYNFVEKYDYMYQYMRNTFQLNPGIGSGENDQMFSEVGLLAGVAATDWSWCPSLADFDNDGLRDMIITNGFPLDITDRDFMAYRSDVGNLTNTEFLLDLIPEVKINNFAFHNRGNLSFDNTTEDWGLNIPSFSNGAAYVDLDNDGDLDYVVNNINDSAFVFKSNLREVHPESSHFLRLSFKGAPGNLNGIGVVVKAALNKGNKFYYEHIQTRGYLSSVEPFCHIGLGSDTLLHELEVIWPNGKAQVLRNLKADQVLELSIEDAHDKPRKEQEPEQFFEEVNLLEYVPKEDDFVDYHMQNLLPTKFSQTGPGLAVSDVDQDGVYELFVGGARMVSGQMFRMDGSGKNHNWQVDAENPDKISEDTGVLFFDANGDGFDDLYVVSGGNELPADDPSFADRLYINNGRGQFSQETGALPESTISGSAVRAADYDKDGDLDLLVVGRLVPYHYPKPASSVILRNDTKNGVAKFTDVTAQLAPELSEVGVISDALWTDFNGDGQVDIVLAGDWMAPTFLENRQSKFKRIKESGTDEEYGLWGSIAAADFDHDGDIDYVFGNAGQNALFKGSREYPVEVYAADFDNNGNYDLIPFVFFPDDSLKRMVQVPFNGLDDVNKQYNSIRSRFITYHKFAKATIDNVLTAEEKEKALHLRANQFASSYLENLGGGKFALHELPVAAQLAPINGMEINDFNLDGHFDVLMVGNNFGNELSVGRYDALNGLLLEGDGSGGFKANTHSGFYAPGDAKSLVSLPLNNRLVLVVGQNQDKVLTYTTRWKGKLVKIKPLTARISYMYKGQKHFRECYYGMSYLSQSSRDLLLPEGATEITQYP